jgi:hypothetical protein
MNEDEHFIEDATIGEKKQRYPWLRALMMVVLYGALMIFLWHFPTEGGRAFFQDLFRAFLYIGVGLVLVGITALFLLLFPFPAIPLPKSYADVQDNDYAYDDDDDFGGVYDAQSLMIPTIDRADIETRVWAILEALESDMDPSNFILFDPDTGIITVMNVDDGDDLFGEVRARLKRAGITTRAPR